MEGKSGKGKLFKDPQPGTSREVSPMDEDYEEANTASNVQREPEITVDMFLSELNDVQLNHLDLPLSEIIFQGFNPREFLIHVERLANAANINRNQHKKNLVLLGLVCALRGSKINKIIDSNGSSRRLKDSLILLRGMYSIVEGRPADRNGCTLPRFLSVTAIPVSYILYIDAGQNATLPLIPDEVAPSYPLVFCMSQAGSLLPVGAQIFDTLAKAVAYGQFLMTKKFGGRAGKHQVYQFVLVAARSNLWTMHQKIAHLMKVRVLSNDNTIHPSCAVAIEEACRKFDALPNN